MSDSILSAVSDSVFGVWFLIGAALVFFMQGGAGGHCALKKRRRFAAKK